MLFSGTIGYQIDGLQADFLGNLQTPNRSPCHGSQPSSNSKFIEELGIQQELFPPKTSKRQQRAPFAVGMEESKEGINAQR